MVRNGRPQVVIAVGIVLGAGRQQAEKQGQQGEDSSDTHHIKIVFKQMSGPKKGRWNALKPPAQIINYSSNFRVATHHVANTATKTRKKTDTETHNGVN
jgi:hypothetical protein